MGDYRRLCSMEPRLEGVQLIHLLPQRASANYAYIFLHSLGYMHTLKILKSGTPNIMEQFVFIMQQCVQKYI